jgi:hypothetical protein
MSELWTLHILPILPATLLALAALVSAIRGGRAARVAAEHSEIAAENAKKSNERVETLLNGGLARALEGASIAVASATREAYQAGFRAGCQLPPQGMEKEKEKEKNP